MCIRDSFICVSFIIISGVSFNFSNHTVRNGIIVSLCGFVVTTVTAIAIPLSLIHISIEAAFPNAQIHRCIIHHISSSTRFLLLSVDLFDTVGTPVSYTHLDVYKRQAFTLSVQSATNQDELITSLRAVQGVTWRRRSDSAAD